ncbi:MAG: hypothetical protein PHI19_05530 [Clostridia bacterium]|nr:hypothetical protein [Clostridia bacterium]
MGNSLQLIDQIKKALNKTRAATEEEKNDSLTLVQKLKEMDSAYKKANALPKTDSSAIPATLGLKPKTFTPKSDAEIIKAAEIALAPEHSKKVEQATSAKEKTVAKLEDNAEDLQIDYAEDAKKLEETAKQLDEAHQDSMIIQGLINSSINESGKNEIDNAYQKQHAVIKQVLNSKLEDIGAKMSLARLDYEQALSQFDLQHAASLESKISSYKIEQEKLKEEVNAYNKKIAEQELKYQQERERKLAELETERLERQAEMEAQTKAYEKEHGYSGDKAAEMENRYRLAYDTYSKLDKEVALELINKQNTDLKATLGLYYQRLIDAIMSR